MVKILADAHIPYLQGVAETFGDVEYLPGNQFSRANIRDKDALIVRTVTRFDDSIFSGSRVKLICSATIGYDHIDTDYCDSHDIAWRTAPGCNANSVEQYVTASLLHLAAKYRFELAEKTIGVVGVGNVGNKVALACEKLGMKVLLNDPPREEREGPALFTDIESIKRDADIITFHTPLTRTGKHKTFHLVDDGFLNSLGQKPFIINAARGEITANQPLVKALQDQKIAGAVIDCWENEPDIDKELLALADIATPHIAGYSADGKWNGTKMSLENLKEFFDLKETPRYQTIPLPQEPLINLKEVAPENQLCHAVWHTYDPMPETEALKKSPGNFYWFRSHYPLRREYPAYSILAPHPAIIPVLRDLGFNKL